MYVYVHVASAAMIVGHALRKIYQKLKMITSGWLLNKLVSQLANCFLIAISYKSLMMQNHSYCEYYNRITVRNEYHYVIIHNCVISLYPTILFVFMC